MEAGDPPTAPSPRPGPAPALSARKKFPTCPPAGPLLPQPKPAAKKKAAAPLAKKGAPPPAADLPPPTPCRQPATSHSAGCAADSTTVDALHPFDEMPSSPRRRRRSPTSSAMEAGDPPTAPSPRPGLAPALPFARPCRRLDSRGAPDAAAPALLPSSSAPRRGPSSTTRKKLPRCPPASPPLPQPNPAAKKKTAAPGAKKGAAPQAAADRPPPTPCRQPATSLAAGCAADSTVVDAHDPFDEMPARDQASEGVNSHLDMKDGSAAIDGIHALRGTVLYQKANMQGKPLSSSRVLEASPPTQRGSRCRGLAVSRRGAGVPQRPDMKRSELEDTSTSEVQRGKVNASKGHSDRRCCPPKSSSLTLVPPSSCRAPVTSTPPQAQPISHRQGVAAVSRRSAGDRRRPGTTRSELEDLSKSAVEHGEVHASTGHSDRRRLSPKSSSLTPAPPSSRRVLVTSPPPQAQPISRRPRVPAISRRGAGDRQRSGTTRIPPQLPDDLLVEILSRLPAKPVHRFKCVSKTWRDLISNPHHRKRLPQALAGLFYQSWCRGEKGHQKKLQFVNMSVRGPPLVNPALAFLPSHASILLADCCNGLLLLFSSYSQPRDYIVCNPATEKWVILPNSGVSREHSYSRLAFDPAVSSHFHVLEYVDDVTSCKVGIFSSRTGGWSWSWSHSVQCTGSVFGMRPDTVFLNGMLHFPCHREVMAIDLETKEWRHIQLPPEAWWSDFFGQSQGCLVHSFADIDSVSLWTLEEYDCGAWSLKHRVSRLQVFGECDLPVVGAFHPECNTLFYPRWHEKGISFMSYDFDREELCHIAGAEFCSSIDLVLPYVPFLGDIAYEPDGMNVYSSSQ